MLLNNDSLEIDIALSTTLAIVAKYDFPAVYPELLQDLLEAINVNEQKSAYITALHFVVKMIATLHATREYSEFEGDVELHEAYDYKMSQLRDFSPSIVMSMVTLWGEMSARLGNQISDFLASGCSNGEAMDGRLCYDTYYTFRVLHTLLICHLPTLHAANPTFFVDFCAMVASRIETCAVLVRATAGVSSSESEGAPSTITYPGSVHFNKLYYKMIKFVVNVQKTHPITFTPVLLSFLHYFMKEFCDWKDEWRGIMVLEAPLIHYMSYLSHVLSTREYQLKYLDESKIGQPKKDPDLEEISAENVSVAHGIVSTFFSHQTLVYLLQTIVGRFFKWQPDRLEVWDEAPEIFWEEDLAEVNFSVRNSAENLFFRLQQYDDDGICAESLRMLQQVRANCEKEDFSLEDILLKDACMSLLSLGYISFSTKEIIDYHQILSMIEQDLALTDERNHKTIRRTIARIMGAWVEEIPADDHKHAWEVLLSLVTEEEDVLVKLSAFSSINDLLGSMDLDYEPYSSCIKPNVDYLLCFMRQVAHTPFAKTVLKEVSAFVVHLGDRISPYTESIVSHITEFWSIADQANQGELKQPIVGILASLCESLPDYSGIYDSLITVASQTTDLEHPDSVLLLEAGMRLWWNLVQTSDELTSDLLALFPRIALIYARVPHDANMTSLTIRLLESYFLIGGAEIVKLDLEGITSMLEQLVSTTSADIITAVLDLLITFFQLFPEDAPAVFRPALARVYHTLFFRFPSRTRIVVRACSLFMQVLLKNPTFFFEFLSDPMLNARNLNSPQTSIDPEAPLPLQRLISRLITVARYLEAIEPEKLWICGFSALFSEALQNEILDPFIPQIADIVVSLILTLRTHTKDTASRKRYTEHSDVITIKGSTVDNLRYKLKSSDITKASVAQIEEQAMHNIISTLRAKGSEWEQELASHVEEQTGAFLHAHLSQLQ